MQKKLILFFLVLILGPPTILAPANGNYCPAGQYTWDAWFFAEAETIHRYSLVADKKRPRDCGYLGELFPKKVGLHERHDRANIRYAKSTDGGLTWEDGGIVIKANEKGGPWPNLAVWSGTVIKKGYQEYLMFLTGRSKDDGEKQKIGLSFSKDLKEWSVPKLILDPDEVDPDLGYDLSRDDDVFPAFRDPSIFFDEDDKIYHMFFAAKTKNNGVTRAAIGHATASPNDLSDWEMQKPLNLTKSYKQIELPHILKKHKKYYLFISTKDNPYPGLSSDKQGAAFRGYISDKLLGEYEPIYKNVVHRKYDNEDKIYGGDMYACIIFRENKVWRLAGFYEEHKGSLALTGAPLVSIKWGGKSSDESIPYIPFFKFDPT